MIIDVHAHFIPTLPGSGEAGADTPGIAAMRMTDAPDDVANRIERMDQAGIDMQLLMTGASHYNEDRKTAVAAARAINEAAARLVQAHPARFAAYLALPLPHVDAAIEELAHWAGDKRFVGIAGHCSVLDRSIGDEQFDPLFEALNRAGAVIFVHPVVNGICSALVEDWGLGPSVGTSFEDTLAVLHLIVRKVPHRFPNLKFIVPHLGGPMPMLLPRLDGQLPWAYPDLPEKPSVTARRFWYDTVAHGSHPALRCACEAFGADRLVTGSDYPILPPDGYASTIEYIRSSGIDAGDVERIINRNAAELFGFSG